MKKILVTGCAGFIGSNYVLRLLKKYQVIGIDNLSRPSTKSNLKILTKYSNFIFCKGDVRNKNFVEKIFKKYGKFFLISHQASQVAVTSSIIYPREDFESNLIGTFNLLEATRIYSKNSIFQYPSTNKVYGDLSEEKILKSKKNYIFKNKKEGISESQNLNFQSPYGCSKGAADQYVVDYYRIFGIKINVFRQSCIYGSSQIGLEDQGWVSWLIIAAILKKRINIFGDGYQARDILWIDDLIDAYILAFKNINKTKGQVFNIGGGKKNILSIKSLILKLKKKKLIKRKVFFKNKRISDQKIYFSNNLKLNKLGWKPKINSEDGLNRIIEWTIKNKDKLKL